MGADAIMWRPWKDDPHLTADLEMAVYGERFRALVVAAREADALSRRRVIFLSSKVRAWYLGDRVWRQLYDGPLIPYPPHSKDMWARDIPMATLLWYRHYGWPVATSYVYMEGSYSLYWQRVSVGTLAPSSVYRESNTVGVTSQALRPEIRMTQPEGVCTQPHRLDTDVSLVIQGDDFDPWRLTVVGTQGMDTPVVVPSTTDSVVAHLEPNLYTWNLARFSEQLLISQGLRHAAYDYSRMMYQELETEREMQRLFGNVGAGTSLYDPNTEAHWGVRENLCDDD
ncbi:hypothetical protein FRX31_027899 [Thalictrum thalictroides]|uniref:Uncharacterized protein n=1 Tax=Thalictrum thalictroides TaxID=46969 RepID=A0A7J6VCA3_THATH|nr:hypothetical protein FRX31_027899 [Thalictrum thalictroides]